MPKRYIIWAQPLTRSAGTRALYTLYDKLRQKGCAALLFCPGEHLERYDYIDILDDATLQNDIVVYPEIVWGNPLRFRNVVRFVLYFSGKLAGETSYHAGEMVFVWWNGYYKAPELRWPDMDTSLFFDARLPKTQNCYFVNKSKPMIYLDQFKDAVEINMDYPATRQELARLLQTTELLYTFDRHSVLNDEAAACGAKVMLVEKDGITPYVPGKMITDAESDALFARFIAQTQSMNYIGELQDDAPFLEKFGGINYKAAMRCAALGAWEQALLFAFRAFQGRPLLRPELGSAAGKNNTPHSPRIPTTWRAVLKKFNSLVNHQRFDKAKSLLYNSMLASIAEEKRDIFAPLATLQSMVLDRQGQKDASLRYAELALLADPLNALAAHLCVCQYLEAGKNNLALMTACRLCGLFLQPLVFEKAFYGIALLGLIVRETGQSPAKLAEKMPQMLQRAVDCVKSDLINPTSPGEWQKALEGARQAAGLENV
jgi:hypothetical protein